MSDICNGLADWFQNGDRGISSNAIVEVMEGYAPGMLAMRNPFGNHPHDPSDFYRCYKLLKAVPEYRTRLNEMMAVSPAWRELVSHWDELETLLLAELERGMAPKLYDRMQALIEAAK